MVPVLSAQGADQSLEENCVMREEKCDGRPGKAPRPLPPSSCFLDAICHQALVHAHATCSLCKRLSSLPTPMIGVP